MKIVAFIQARVGSSRLPRKVLLHLEDKRVIEHVISRVAACRLIDEVVVVTTIGLGDLDIVGLCASAGIRVFCGSEDDVLDRYYQAAKLIMPDHIVRITADCPMIDPLIIEKVVRTHLDRNADYSSNVLIERYPDGEDVEIFSFKALKVAWENALMTSEREHVTPFIRNNPERFHLESVEHTVDLSHYRWTLDRQEDYDFLEAVFHKLYPANPSFGMNEVLDLLKKNPELAEINGKITRNEGYQKSISNDIKLMNRQEAN